MSFTISFGFFQREIILRQKLSYWTNFTGKIYFFSNFYIQTYRVHLIHRQVPRLGEWCISFLTNKNVFLKITRRTKIHNGRLCFNDKFRSNWIPEWFLNLYTRTMPTGFYLLWYFFFFAKKFSVLWAQSGQESTFPFLKR